MKRDVIEKILARAPGVEASKDRYKVSEEHRLSLYLGEAGRAMVVGEIDRIVLDEDFLEVTTREDETVLYVSYDAVQAVSFRPPKESRGRRAGFA